MKTIPASRERRVGHRQGNTINGEAQQLATTVQKYAKSHCGQR
jgi:hypothetical protein